MYSEKREIEIKKRLNNQNKILIRDLNGVKDFIESEITILNEKHYHIEINPSFIGDDETFNICVEYEMNDCDSCEIENFLDRVEDHLLNLGLKVNFHI